MRRLAALFAVACVATGCDIAGAPSPTANLVSPSPSAAASPEQTVTASTIPSPTAVAPPAGRIAFALSLGEEEGSEVFLVNTDGSGTSQLTTEGGAADNIVWAPDGSRLYFTVGHAKACGTTMCFPKHVISIRPDGTDRRDLGQIGAYGVGTVSPDRRFVAYPTGEGYPEGTGQSFTIPTRLLDLTTGKMGNRGSAGSVWSPDSTRLLGVARDHISVVDVLTGDTVIRIDDPWAEPSAQIGWSPDGGSVFYHRCSPTANKLEAMTCMAGPSWVVDLADENLIPEPNVGPEPPRGTRSPDGQWMATLMSGDVPEGLYLVPAIGGEPRLVTRLKVGGDPFESQPSWSPDGAWLAVGIVGGIHLVPVAGGDPIPVTAGGGPAWQPLPVGG